MVQGAVGWVRDDVQQFNRRNNQAREAGSGSDLLRSRKRPPVAAPATPVEGDRPAENRAQGFASAVAGYALTVSDVLQGTFELACLMVEAVLWQLVALFRRRNGAPPPAPRIAVLMILTLFVWVRRHRRYQQPPTQQQPQRTDEDSSSPGTPGRSSIAAESAPPRTSNSNQIPSSEVAAAAGGLFSPSRSLFLGSSRASAGSLLPAALPAPGSPSRRRDDELERPDGLDPSLPSPAQARTGQARALMMRRLARRAREQHVGGVVGGGQRRVGGRATCVQWLRGWRCFRISEWTWWRESRSSRSRWCWFWILLLWFVASVLEVK